MFILIFILIYITIKLILKLLLLKKSSFYISVLEIILSKFTLIFIILSIAYLLQYYEVFDYYMINVEALLTSISLGILSYISYLIITLVLLKLTFVDTWSANEKQITYNIRALKIKNLKDNNSFNVLTSSLSTKMQKDYVDLLLSTILNKSNYINNSLFDYGLLKCLFCNYNFSSLKPCKLKFNSFNFSYYLQLCLIEYVNKLFSFSFIFMLLIICLSFSFYNLYTNVFTSPKQILTSLITIALICLLIQIIILIYTYIKTNVLFPKDYKRILNKYFNLSDFKSNSDDLSNIHKHNKINNTPIPSYMNTYLNQENKYLCCFNDNHNTNKFFSYIRNKMYLSPYDKAFLINYKFISCLIFYIQQLIISCSIIYITTYLLIIRSPSYKQNSNYNIFTGLVIDNNLSNFFMLFMFVILSIFITNYSIKYIVLLNSLEVNRNEVFINKTTEHVNMYNSTISNRILSIFKLQLIKNVINKIENININDIDIPNYSLLNNKLTEIQALQYKLISLNKHTLTYNSHFSNVDNDDVNTLKENIKKHLNNINFDNNKFNSKYIDYEKIKFDIKEIFNICKSLGSNYTNYSICMLKNAFIKDSKVFENSKNNETNNKLSDNTYFNLKQLLLFNIYLVETSIYKPNILLLVAFNFIIDKYIKCNVYNLSERQNTNRLCTLEGYYNFNNFNYVNTLENKIVKAEDIVKLAFALENRNIFSLYEKEYLIDLLIDLNFNEISVGSITHVIAFESRDYPH